MLRNGTDEAVADHVDGGISSYETEQVILDLLVLPVVSNPVQHVLEVDATAPSLQAASTWFLYRICGVTSVNSG